jgi:hypothetical protein
MWDAEMAEIPWRYVLLITGSFRAWVRIGKIFKKLGLSYKPQAFAAP